MEITGVTDVDFHVEPFLKIEWVGDPVVNGDKSVTINVKFTRGTANDAYQSNVSDVYLFTCWKMCLK